MLCIFGIAPSRGDIFCIRLLRVHPTTASEICKLQAVVHDEDVFGLDVSMENAIAMHMVHAFHQLPHAISNKVLRQVMAPASNELIDVHIH